jgi:peroxiredoxin
MRLHTLAGLAALIVPAAALAQPAASKPASGPTAIPAGHSMHGEAFNEGPRQAAYLMGGTGRVHLEVTTKGREAQQFFDQGVGQLHGFWYFEAERSFRQVAALDPGCAMAYWGMAMANWNNPKRAQGFIGKAVEKKAGAGRREQLWIDAYANFWTGKTNDNQRRQELTNRLEDLSYEFPSELEARAFLCFHIYDNNYHGQPIPSRKAFDALLGEVLAAEPMHPVHHYRIHLWDSDKAVRALGSAARSGQSAPNIAHMWHMGGHTFVKLHRYADAAWQQEASARVDHRHMMRDRYLPDQIHNYTHNNQWLVEDLEYVGRAHDAVALAKNLIELPRHPRYNTLGQKPDGMPLEKNHGSSGEGRRRLFEVLTRFELWDELIALTQTMYLEPTDIPAEQVKRLRLLGVAHFAKGDAEKGREQIRVLEALLQKLRTERQAAADEAEAKTRRENKPADQVTKAIADAMQKFGDRLTTVETALAELHGYDFLARGDKVKAAESFDRAKDMPKDRLARAWVQAGDSERAIKLAREVAGGGEGQVHRLATYVDVLHRAGKEAEAKEQFKKLRPLSADIDLDVPVMKRIAPLAKSLDLPDDWRVPKVVPADAGQRPDLKDLGPVHWQPVAAPGWSLPDEHGKQVSLGDYRGRPVIVIFFLGSGCPHCIEQLNAFEPMLDSFAAAGISLVAVSTDSVEGLRKTFEKSKTPAKMPLVSDAGLDVFKGYRAFDDFENKPLHGTFLIDGDGRIRWQDVSYEPFREVRFLLAESKRLLDLSKAPAAAPHAAGR